jgi:hypothetical protein
MIGTIDGGRYNVLPLPPISQVFFLPCTISSDVYYFYLREICYNRLLHVCQGVVIESCYENLVRINGDACGTAL